MHQWWMDSTYEGKGKWTLVQGIESHPRSKGGTQAEVDGGNAGVKECDFFGDDRICIRPKLSAFKSNPAGG